MYLPELQMEPILPFSELNCSSCLLKKLQYCEGADNLKNYSMKHPSLIGCHNLKRIEKFSDEIFDRIISPPNSFHQDKIDFSILPFGIADARIDITQFKEIPLFAISMNDFIKESGDLIFRDLNHLRTTLKIPINAKVALIGTSNEKIQQAIWRFSEKLNIWKRIADFGFEWITSTTFPVWDENPRSDQIIHQLRNYLVTDLVANLGQPIIPFVYPFNECDYRTLKRWIKERPSITKLAVLAQYYNTDNQFSQLVKNMNLIQEYAGREFEFLVVGVTKITKLKKVLSSFKKANVISWSPYYEAFLKGNLYDKNLKSAQRLDIDRSDLSFQNYKTFAAVIEEIRENQNECN